MALPVDPVVALAEAHEHLIANGASCRRQGVHADLAADQGARFEWSAFQGEFDRLYGVFNAVNRMFLMCDKDR